jgi:Flp pilus assembly pilin Flp
LFDLEANARRHSIISFNKSAFSVGSWLYSLTERVPGSRSSAFGTRLAFCEEGMRRLITRALADDSGQDLIEYAMLAGFISLIAITAITSIGGYVNGWYEGYANTISTIPGAS